MKKTKALVNKLLEELEKHGVIQYACDKYGISRNTFYRWMKEDKSFLERANEAMSLGVGGINDMALSNLVNGIKNKDMASTKFWLIHRHAEFRRPYVHRVDSDDLIAHHRMLAEGTRLRQIESDISETLTLQQEARDKEAQEGAREFMRKWNMVNQNAIDEKAKALHEQWKKEEQDKKAT